MKRCWIIVLVIVVVFLSISCGSKGTVTDELLNDVYNSGYKAEVEKDYSNEKASLPVENKKPTASMISTPDSSCFSSVGYDDGILYVTFRDSGSVYSYVGVPSYVYDELWSASSMGGYYNSSIKGYYECHRLF